MVGMIPFYKALRRPTWKTCVRDHAGTIVLTSNIAIGKDFEMDIAEDIAMDAETDTNSAVFSQVSQ
jgi:hypothetical protein